MKKVNIVKIDDAEALAAAHHILEIDVVVVAFRLSGLQWAVLIVFHAGHEFGAGDGCAAAGQTEQVSLGYPTEQGFPLFGVELILAVELHGVDRGVGIGLGEAVAPCAAVHPCCGLGYLGGVGAGLSVDGLTAIAGLIGLTALAGLIALATLTALAAVVVLGICCDDSEEKPDDCEYLFHIAFIITLLLCFCIPKCYLSGWWPAQDRPLH